MSELANLRVEDLDLDQDVAIVVGKGRRARACPFGSRTGQAIDRYMRMRSKHHAAAQPWVWVGKRGRMNDSGVYQMIIRRAAEPPSRRTAEPPSRSSFALRGAPRGLSARPCGG